jgi:hypothetical protein
LDELHFLDPEIEAMPWLAQPAKIAAWVVIEHDGQVDALLKILLDRFDRSGLSVQGYVEDVRSTERVQPYPVAVRQVKSTRLYSLEARSVE